MSLDKDLTGQVALVTGATRGIGKAIALRLQALGATVIGTATTETGANQITDMLQGGEGQGLVLNVADPSSIASFFVSLKEQSLHPTVLVNNAGITRDNLLLRMKDDEWDAVINTNLSAIYRLSKACLRAMSKARWGRIINISSVVATTGNPGQVNYAAAKAGLEGFTKSLAREMSGRGITVNCVAPGFIETDMTKDLSAEMRDNMLQQIPVGRLGRAEEIAHAVAFLASHDAAYITGVTLPVNGGMVMQ